MNLLQTFIQPMLFEPLYRLEMSLSLLERELLQSSPLRRLKHLHHYGAAALITPVNHSRLEHTLGVWSLTKHFFPSWEELHIAALLHDIGHLPFSHAIERSLNFSHHSQTERLICSEPIASILTRHGFSSELIVSLLNRDTPLSNNTNGLCIDHLDSFFRDTHATGLNSAPPHELILNIYFNGNVAQMDQETAMHVWHSIYADNKLFLTPELLAVDAILSRAVEQYLVVTNTDILDIAIMNDSQLLAIMSSIGCPDIDRMLNILLLEPHQLQRCIPNTDGALHVCLHKAYLSEPFVNGSLLTDLNPLARRQKVELKELIKEFWFNIII